MEKQSRHYSASVRKNYNPVDISDVKLTMEA